MSKLFCLLLIACLALGCKSAKTASDAEVVKRKRVTGGQKNPKPVVHVLVALCDNKYQGIVPVSARLGNGDDLNDNLYWGSMYGVKAYFNSKHR